MSNQEIPRGPEDIPLKNYVKEHWIMVIIFDVKANRATRAEKVNYSDPEARRWLGRLTYWATTNNYEIRTCAEADYKVEL